MFYRLLILQESIKGRKMESPVWDEENVDGYLQTLAESMTDKAVDIMKSEPRVSNCTYLKLSYNLYLYLMHSETAPERTEVCVINHCKLYPFGHVVTHAHAQQRAPGAHLHV